MRTHCDVGGGSLRNPKILFAHVSSRAPARVVAGIDASRQGSRAGEAGASDSSPANASRESFSLSQGRRRAVSLEADNMRRFLALLLGLALGAMILCPSFVPVAMAGDTGLLRDEVMRKPTLNASRYRSGFSTAAAATVWYGFKASSTDPNKVGVGGKWDFDTPYYAGDITGTDSSQFWTFIQAPQASDGTTKYLTPQSRPFWYYDFGNNVNAGDHNLTVDRLANGRITRMTGLAGVWHQDNLTTVPDTGTVAPGFATNLAGAGSAWCGLRLTGDTNAPVDPYTGNRYTSALQYNDFRASGGAPRSAYPGYAAQWDQLMYRDFTYNSVTPGTVAFQYR